MENYPERLVEYLDYFRSIQDRSERIDLLTSFAEQYSPVSESIARRPYPKENRVEFCESEVYLWATESSEQRLKFHFAVENPQGIAAMATVAILQEALSEAPLNEIRGVDPEVVLSFFGAELSTRKQIGLIQIVKQIQQLVQRFKTTGRI